MALTHRFQGTWLHVSTRNLKEGEDKAAVQLLLVEDEVSPGMRKILGHPEVLDLINSPADIVDVMPDHFIRSEADVHELLSIFSRFVRDVRG